MIKSRPLAVLLFWLSLTPVFARDLAVITNVTVTQDKAGQTIVLIHGTGPLQARTQSLDEPIRLVLDFDGGSFAVPHNSIPGAGVVRGIRVAQFQAVIARLVVDLEKPALPVIKASGNNLIVTFPADTPAASVATPASTPAPTPAPTPALEPAKPTEAASVATPVASPPATSTEATTPAVTAKAVTGVSASPTTSQPAAPITDTKPAATSPSATPTTPSNEPPPSVSASPSASVSAAPPPARKPIVRPYPEPQTPSATSQPTTPGPTLDGATTATSKPVVRPYIAPETPPPAAVEKATPEPAGPEPTPSTAATEPVTGKAAAPPAPAPVSPPMVAKATTPRSGKASGSARTPTRPSLTPSTTGMQTTVDRGLLTLHAENKSAQSVLDDIAARSGLSIQASPEVGKSSVSADFSGTPLDMALRQMLKDYEVGLFYAPGQDPGPESLKKVVVFLPGQTPPGQSPQMQAASGKPANDGPSEAEWKERNKSLEQEEIPSDDDSTSRIAEVDMLIRREGRESMGVLLNALKSPSSKMRHQALQRALAIGVPIPEQTLIDVALNDNSQEVRFVALQALPVDPRLKWVADRAAKDPSAQVSSEARDILHEYEGKTSP